MLCLKKLIPVRTLIFVTTLFFKDSHFSKDGHFWKNGHGRSFLVERSWTVIFGRKVMDGSGWTRRSRWVDAGWTRRSRSCFRIIRTTVLYK